MISFNAITKRSDFYISTPIDDYVLTLTNIDIINIIANSSKKFVMTLKINENKDKKILSMIEKLSLDTVIKNNKKWFHNNLEYQDIIDNYIPCFNEQNNTLDIILHSDYFPKLEGYVDLDDLIKNKGINCLQNITIKLIGIYIKNNSFYVRWLVRNIEKIETNNDDIQNIDELFDIKYKRLIEKIDNKIEYLKNTKKDLKRIYDTKDFEALIKSFYLILDKI
jgi:hypothetical protein|tara:strand:- start:13 stop:678 length:666 start_codon:yes stop_codon:yes gene_type:complete